MTQKSFCIFALSCTLFTATTNNTSAQSQTKLAKEVAAENTADMSKYLFLTDEQRQKIDAINYTYAIEMQKMIVNGSNEDFFTVQKRLDDNRQSQLAEVLEVQQEQLNEHITDKEVQQKNDFIKRQLQNTLYLQNIALYANTQIFPVLEKNRAFLDPNISENDQKLLEQYRLEALQIVADLSTAVKNNPDSENWDPKDIGMRIFKENKTMIKDLRAMTERYEEPLNKIMIDLGSQEEIWRNDLQKLSSGFVTDAEKKEIDKEQRRMQSLGMKYLGSRMGFLLLSPQNTGAFLTMLTNELKIDLSPNPLVNEKTQNISFEAPQKMAVYIDLVDANGKIIKNICNQTYAPGKISIKADVSNLEKGKYYYILKLNKGLQVIPTEIQ
jgi:Spy/CpxP family protein refolding chaperone